MFNVKGVSRAGAKLQKILLFSERDQILSLWHRVNFTLDVTTPKQPFEITLQPPRVGEMNPFTCKVSLNWSHRTSHF